MEPLEHSKKQERLLWLADIYRTYAADTQRYILSKVGDPFLAEDLTSIVFLKALRWLKSGLLEESIRGWLYATARTTISDHWQTLGRYETQTLSSLENLFSWQNESSELAQQQTELRVQRLLSLLPERERKVLELRYLQGYSAAEMAQALGTSAGHIRVLQLRALRHAAQLESQERNTPLMQEANSSFDPVIQILTPESRRVLDLARQEALNLNHNFIGTEHMLWGLASEGSLSSFLNPLGITPERVHAGIVFIFERHGGQQGTQDTLSPEAFPDAITLLTPRARQTIVLAGEEAKNQGEQQIRPTHLLLGLMNEGGGIGAGLLRSLGVTLPQARSALTAPDTAHMCSFCGRTGSQVKRIFFAQPDLGSASQSICDQCIERFHNILAQS